MTTSLHYTALCILVDNIYNNQNEINYFSDNPHGTKNFQTMNLKNSLWYLLLPFISGDNQLYKRQYNHIQKFYMVLTLHLCVVYESQIRQ